MIISGIEYPDQPLSDENFMSLLSRFREQQAKKSAQKNLTDADLKVLSELERHNRLSLRYLINKNLHCAVVHLLTLRRVRLVGAEENQFVEVVA